MSFLAAIVSASLMLLIPPALPGDAERFAEVQKQREQTIADLNAPEAKNLIDDFFVKVGEGESFDLAILFTVDARYVDEEGQSQLIAANLDDDGFPDIAQWSPIASGLLGDCWAVIADHRLDYVGVREAVLKFYFGRNASGGLKISRIERVDL